MPTLALYNKRGKKKLIKRSDSTFSHSTLNYRVMRAFNASIQYNPLTNIELSAYAQELEILHFSGVFMRETLPTYPFNVESGIVNLNTSNQAGSHWVCYYRNKNLL